MTDKPQINFHEAIEMGEYNPEVLSNYSEWKTFSKHTQLQFIRKGLDNRARQLVEEWAEVNNVLNFNHKPHLNEVLKNIEKQMKKVEEDRERLYIEFTSEK